MLKCKIISGLDKPLLGSKIEDYKERTNISVLRGEKATFQLIYTMDYRKEGNYPRFVLLDLSGELAKYTTVRDVHSVPAIFNHRGTVDDDFITTAPPLFPTFLRLCHSAAEPLLATARSNPSGLKLTFRRIASFRARRSLRLV